MHGTAVAHKRKSTATLCGVYTTLCGVYNNNGIVMNPSANTLPKAQYTNRSKQAEHGFPIAPFLSRSRASQRACCFWTVYFTLS